MERGKSALVILSGGQDSTTCLFLAKERFEVVHAVTFDYGQRHRLEIDAARNVAKMAGVASHEVVEVPNCLHSTSPLTSSNELEKYENHAQMEGVIKDRVELTFVPMRNTLFFTIAMNRAVALGCDTLVTGICEADNANYPDCTESFRSQLEKSFNTSLGFENRFHIWAPLMWKSKADTVKLAVWTANCWGALAFTHTSYDGKYPPVDKNHANVLRAHGFEQAGLPDPLVVRAVRDGLMEIPTTPNYSKSKVDETWRLICMSKEGGAL